MTVTETDVDGSSEPKMFSVSDKHCVRLRKSISYSQLLMAEILLFLTVPDSSNVKQWRVIEN